MVIVQRPTLFRIVPRVEFTIRSACEYEVAEKRILAALVEGRRTTAVQPLWGTYENGELSALVTLPRGEPRTKVRARLGVTRDGRAALQGEIRPPLVHLFVFAPMAGAAMTMLLTSTLDVPGWLAVTGVIVGIVGAAWLAAWSLFPLRVLRTRGVLQRVLREPVPGENSHALPPPSSPYRSRQTRSRLILRHRTRPGE